MMQNFLVLPPDDLDEGIVGVAAIGVGAVADPIERRIVRIEQRCAPLGGGGDEGGDRPGGVAVMAVGGAGQAVAAVGVVGAAGE